MTGTAALVDLLTTNDIAACGPGEGTERQYERSQEERNSHDFDCTKKTTRRALPALSIDARRDPVDTLGDEGFWNRRLTESLAQDCPMHGLVAQNGSSHLG